MSEPRSAPLSVLTAATLPCRHIHLLHSGGRISELLAWPEAYAASDHISDAVDSAARPGPLGCSGGGSCKRVRRRRSASSPFLAQFQIPPSRFDNQSPPNNRLVLPWRGSPASDVANSSPVARSLLSDLPTVLAGHRASQLSATRLSKVQYLVPPILREMYDEEFRIHFCAYAPVLLLQYSK